MADISARQSDALEAIREHVDANGYPPTLAELGQRLGVSGAGARQLLLSLAAAGAVRIVPRSPRAITIVEPVDVEAA